MKRTVLAAALLIGRLASAGAEESAGEPSALACNEFRAGAARTLGSAPDALQVNNLLFEASRKGCVGALDALFKAGASRLARDHAGNTALSIAAKMGRLPVVKALLELGSARRRRATRSRQRRGFDAADRSRVGRPRRSRQMADRRRRRRRCGQQKGRDRVERRRFQRRRRTGVAAAGAQGAAGYGRRHRQGRDGLCGGARRGADRGDAAGRGGRSQRALSRRSRRR